MLGGQIVGYEGVDKRIDVLASVIYFKGTVKDLSQLELAYAPPYSSAKDPLNFAGYMGMNILEGLTDPPIFYHEWAQNPDAYTLLDIREPDETIAGSIPGALLIPHSQLRERISELDKSKTYAILCRVGRRGFISERLLKQHGFKVKNFAGGLQSYHDMEYDITMNTNTTPPDTKASNIPPAEIAPVASTVGKLETLDVCGLSCPGPIVQVANTLKTLNDGGDQLDVTASDPGFTRDIAAWCKNTGNTLIKSESEKGIYRAIVQKGLSAGAGTLPQTVAQTSAPLKEKTMIIFDNDLDKAIAAFIIANGAAAMGNKVHMFFTFWGLSILRKEQYVPVKKDFMGKMFGMMLPQGLAQAGGAFANEYGWRRRKMIRGIMKHKGIDSLNSLSNRRLTPVWSWSLAR